MILRVKERQDNQPLPPSESAPAAPQQSLNGESFAWICAAKNSQEDDIWSWLNERYGSRLLIYANLRLGKHLRQHHAPADLVQEAWLRVIRKFADFEYRGSDSLMKWLCQNVNRIAAEWGRKKGAASAGATGEGHEQSFDSVSLLPAKGRGPQTEAGGIDTIRRIVRSLEDHRMPETYREILVAIFLEGQSRDEVAAERGLKPDTLRRQINRGLGHWREILGEDPMRFI